MSRRLDICHLTVLNPARHPRIFYKQACAQASMGYQVAVVGQDDSSRVPYKLEGVTIYPLPYFERLSFLRWTMSLRLLYRALRLRARAYVLHSPELLPLGLVLRVLTGARLIYDMHEDYPLTLAHAPHYPEWLRPRLSKWVRKLELFSLKYLGAVSYAEAIYLDILEAGEKAFLVRNKYHRVAPTTHFAAPDRPYLLYTGTIDPVWGIWDSLAFWNALPEDTDIDLIIAGYSAQPAIIAELRERIANSRQPGRIRLIGGATFVPYAQISTLIQGCTAGLGLYQLEPFIQGKIPTKFYEFLAAGRPLVYTPDENWDAFNAETRLGFSWSPDEPAWPVWEGIQAWQAPPPHPEHYAWESEIPTLAHLTEQVVGPPTSPVVPILQHSS
ncbi:MAG: hypothetical protein D6722_03005 [Bacteroidetes bacterium]|nr:MAG: hypothetical protein D6722_03005 [Bacteroidota bacterium]